MRRLTFFSLLLVLLFAHICSSQVTKGTISGTVVDNGGAVLKGAQLKLLPLGMTAVTDEQGEFTFIDIPVGAYTISVSYVGFEPAETKVQLAAGQGLWIWPLSPSYLGKVARPGFILGFGSTAVEEVPRAVRQLRSLLTGK